MSRPGVLGGARSGLGLVLGAAAGLGLLCAFYLHRRKRTQSHGGNWNASNSLGYTRTPEPRRQVMLMRAVPGEAGDAMSVPSIPREKQEEVLDRLDFVLSSLTELRQEVEELRNSLRGLAGEIVGEVKSQMEENQKVTRRRRYPFNRERRDSTGSSSIYFSANSGVPLTEGESEGGYTTANAESDYDWETEKESGEDEDEVSCETVKTGRRDSQDLTGDGDSLLLPVDSAGGEELLLLLQQADELHQGNQQNKQEGFQRLLNNKLAYGNRQDFLWRLARAYSDMCDISEGMNEKKSYAQSGKEEAEAALEKGDESAESHQWYAVLCGQQAEHEGIQRRIQSGYIFKDHIDRAIALQPDNPKSHFLLGRWCYQVSHLTWLEKKTAGALFESPPSATVHDALQSFLKRAKVDPAIDPIVSLLKAEELSPGFSKAGRVFISKCYRELGNNSEAAQWMKLALELPDVTNEDVVCHKDLEELRIALEE